MPRKKRTISEIIEDQKRQKLVDLMRDEGEEKESTIYYYDEPPADDEDGGCSWDPQMLEAFEDNIILGLYHCVPEVFRNELE